MAAPDLVNAILQQMHGAGPGGGMPMGGGPPGGPGGGSNGHGMNPLDQIQSLIQDLHDAMRNIGDPQIVNVLATCLRALTGVQQQLMQTQGGK